MLNQLIKQFSNYSLIPLNDYTYQLSPGLSFHVFQKFSQFKKISLTSSGPGFPAIIQFKNNNDIDYHALILAYLSILSKIKDINTFESAYNILQNKGIFDNIQ